MFSKFGKFRGEVDGIFTHHSIQLSVDLNIKILENPEPFLFPGITDLTGGGYSRALGVVVEGKG